MVNQANRLIEFLKEKKGTTESNFAVGEILVAAKEIKIGEKEEFSGRFARAAVFMALGVNHPNLDFAKEKFYERVDSFCRQAVKVVAIVKKNHAQ